MVIYRASRTDEARFHTYCTALAERLDTLWDTPPVPYRQQNGGDYAIPALTLKEELAPGETGFGIHLRRD